MGKSVENSKPCNAWAVYDSILYDPAKDPETTGSREYTCPGPENCLYNWMANRAHEDLDSKPGIVFMRQFGGECPKKD